MSKVELDRYESEAELALLQEYRELVGQFRYVVETERRFYLANHVAVEVHNTPGGEVFFELDMRDCWVWDVYRAKRRVASVQVLSFKDISVEETGSEEAGVGETGVEETGTGESGPAE